MVKVSSTARQIKDFVRGAAFSLTKSFMSLTTQPPTGSNKGHAEVKLPPNKYSNASAVSVKTKVENQTYGPFEEQM